MPFGHPKNFCTSRCFFLVQQSILVGGNQNAYRAGNTQFHRCGYVPCTNFVNNQKITLVFVGIDDGFAFAKIQVRYTHQHADGIAVAD